MFYHPKMTPFDRLMTVMKELRWKDSDFYKMANEAKQNFNGWKKRKSIPQNKNEKVAAAIGVRVEWLLTGKKDSIDERLGIRLGQCLTGTCATPESASIHSTVPFHHLHNALEGRYQLSDAEYELLAKVLDREVIYIQRIFANTDNTPEYYRKEDLERFPSSTRQGLQRKENTSIMLDEDNSMPWPDSPDQINPVMLDDIAKQVFAAIDPKHQVSNQKISRIINQTIEEHYDIDQGSKNTEPNSLTAAVRMLSSAFPSKALINIYENIEASAGDGSVVGYELPTDHLWVENKWLQEIVHFVPKDMAIIKVRGDSMEPTLSPGDMILIDRQPIERNQLNDGIYVINRGDTTHVKRLQCVESGIRIISDNQAYATETVTNNITICGRVIWAWRGKRF